MFTVVASSHLKNEVNLAVECEMSVRLSRREGRARWRRREALRRVNIAYKASHSAAAAGGGKQRGEAPPHSQPPGEHADYADAIGADEPMCYLQRPYGAQRLQRLMCKMGGWAPSVQNRRRSAGFWAPRWATCSGDRPVPNTRYSSWPKLGRCIVLVFTTSAPLRNRLYTFCYARSGTPKFCL